VEWCFDEFCAVTGRRFLIGIKNPRGGGTRRKRLDTFLAERDWKHPRWRELWTASVAIFAAEAEATRGNPKFDRSGFVDVCYFLDGWDRYRHKAEEHMRQAAARRREAEEAAEREAALLPDPAFTDDQRAANQDRLAALMSSIGKEAAP